VNRQIYIFIFYCYLIECGGGFIPARHGDEGDEVILVNGSSAGAHYVLNSLARQRVCMCVFEDSMKSQGNKLITDDVVGEMGAYV